MARQRSGQRVLGPYRHIKGGTERWRIVIVDAEGRKAADYFETKVKAESYAKILRMNLPDGGGLLHDALARYERYLLDEKGNKKRSVETTIGRLKKFFDDDSLCLYSLKISSFQDIYTKRRMQVTTDTHRNELGEAKTFLRWGERKGLVPRSLIIQIDKVQGTGRRNHGKPQLRIDEAIRWKDTAIRYADEGHDGAVAAMMCLFMGMRASEVVERVVRDLDDGGRLLWIPDAKTAKGRRTIEVPELLQNYLLRLCENKGSEDRLFGNHWRDWPRKWTNKLCKAAGVLKVSAQAMRGLHSTLSEEAGVTSHVVAQSLGHESIRTTRKHYTQPSAVENARQRKVVEKIGNGRQKDSMVTTIKK